MNRLFLYLLLTASLFSSQFTVDKESSFIRFEINKMFFMSVSGEFKEFSGSIELNGKGRLSKVDGLVSVESMDTDDQKRDDRIKADDYFYVTKFPNIVFKSDHIYGDSLKATISIKGVEKDIYFRLEEFQSSKNRVSFKLRSTINRQDFMLNGSMSSLISDEVSVTAKIVATK